MAKKEEKRGSSLLYVKARTMEDIARYAYSPDVAPKNLVCTKSGNSFRLVVFGEHINDTVMAYYVDIADESNAMRYTLPNSYERESAVLAVGNSANEKNSMSVLRMDLSVFKEEKDISQEDILLIMVSSADDIVNTVARRSAREEISMPLYSFERDGKKYIAGFDLVEELNDDRKTFYYAVLQDKECKSFIKYNYADNTFSLTNSVDEHAYIYLKVMNLEQAFPFFKVPD